MKNVAIIVQRLTGGGAERVAANMSLELQKRYNVYLVVFGNSETKYPYGGTLINLNVPSVKSAAVSKRILNTYKRVRALRKFKKQYNIDCSISHLENANIVNILSRNKDKIISVYHNMPSRALKKTYFNILLQNFIGRFSDKYIFVSKSASSDAVKNFHLPQNKANSIYNFCDADKIQTMVDENLDCDKADDFYRNHSKIIINVARLSEAKAQHHLIKAFYKLRKDCPDAGLVILGEGDKREKLEELINAYGICENVYMPGNVKNPFKYIKKADVFAFCSHYEGLPMVLVEALACASPIVSTDMPSGAREILAPNTNFTYTASKKEYAEFGILVPVCDDVICDELSVKENLLADAILEMLNDDALRQKYIAKSAECINNFRPEFLAQQWYELIDK